MSHEREQKVHEGSPSLPKHSLQNLPSRSKTNGLIFKNYGLKEYKQTTIANSIYYRLLSFPTDDFVLHIFLLHVKRIVSNEIISVGMISVTTV